MIAPDSHPVRTPLGHLITMCGDRRGKHMARTNDTLSRLLVEPELDPCYPSPFVTAQIARWAPFGLPELIEQALTRA